MKIKRKSPIARNKKIVPRMGQLGKFKKAPKNDTKVIAKDNSISTDDSMEEDLESISDTAGSLSDAEESYLNAENNESDSGEDEELFTAEDSQSVGSAEEDNSGDELQSHKESLARLQETDPEFYKFLQDNDKKLLQFNLSDSEAEDDDNEEEKFHKPQDGDLEIASDESDFEGEEDETKEGDNKMITLRMLKVWQVELQSDKSNETIGSVIKAFHAALLRVSNVEGEEQQASYYKVDGSSVFNAIIQLCVLELGPAIRRFLGLVSGSKLAPHKCKKFVKVKSLLKSYFTDLLKLLSGVTSSNILTVLLKHLHYVAPMIVSFPNITKGLLKKLVEIWGTSTESVRVIAFLCIVRITTNQQANLLDSVLKMMYMTYVRNSKFVSTNTLSGINFMRRSLVEMYALDVNVSYQHVFLYIRQLAIHLRNAIVVNKKENLQAVYNWQFVNSLKLWGNLFAVTCNKPQLQPLIYPFVQVCLGTIKLVPTTQYFPLRFHVVQMLMDLARDTGVFIPVLPFLLEVLTTYDFNKKHTKVSIKPLNFTCLLRLSKSQLSENGFKDTCIDTVYGQILEYLANQSYTIAFPDISLFCIIQIKQFVKACSVASYCRKMRQLVEKIEQNAKFIENERKTVSFTLSAAKLIEAWETTVKNKGTPLLTFYESWDKLRNIKKNKQVTNNEELGEYNLPTIKKVKNAAKAAENGPVTLFPSDSESDDGPGFGKEAEEKKKATKRGKRAGKNQKKRLVNASVLMDEYETDDQKDIVADFKATDW